MSAVAEHGTLTRAAEVLHSVQSSLSHHLADLEERVGSPLFVRAARRMVLTPAGERVLAAAREVLASVATVEDDLRDLLAEREAVVRIATECYTCYHWLPRVLGSFALAHPRVEARLVPQATDRVIAALLAGDLDVAIATETGGDRRLVRRPLFEDELVALSAPGHPWSEQRFVTVEDFKHLICYSPPERNNFVRQVLAPAGVMPRRLAVVPLTEAIVELVRAGQGVAVLARWAVLTRYRRRPAYLDAFVAALQRELGDARRESRTAEQQRIHREGGGYGEQQLLMCGLMIRHRDLRT